MIYAALALLLGEAGVPSQDPKPGARVSELIEMLHSDSVVERDTASQELVQIGPGALAKLREALKDGNAEVRARAQGSIRAIELALKVKEICREPGRVTLDVKNVPLAQIAQALVEQTGTKLDAAPVSPALRFSLTVKDAPLLQALDALCGSAEKLAYEWTESDAIRFSLEKRAVYPAAYAGAFRLRVKSLQVTRTQNFEDAKAMLQLVLEPDHDKCLRPLRSWTLAVDEALDDRGKKLTLAEHDKAARRAAMMGVADPRGDRTFLSTDLSPEARKLSVLRVTAAWRFVLESEDITFESPARGDLKNVGRFTVAVSAMSTDSAAGSTTLQLTFSAKEGTPEDVRREIEGRFESASVVLIDDKGQEHTGTRFVPNELRFGREVPETREVEYSFSFSKRIPRAERKALKLRFHHETYEKKVTFDLRDLKLP